MNFNQQISLIMEDMGDSRKSIHKNNIRVGDILVYKYSGGNYQCKVESIEKYNFFDGKTYYKYKCSSLEGPVELVVSDIAWRRTNDLFLQRKQFKPEDRDFGMGVLDI